MKFKEVTQLVTEEQKKLFNMAMENIKGYSTCKSKKNQIGIVAIDLSLLYVDERYQGLRKHKKIKKLINKWDERQLTPITVVAHPEEYRFAVVDGQGRLRASKELGYDTLQAIVLLDAPQDDPMERLRFEAEVFVGQDEEVEDLQELEKHLARVILGYKPAIILENMFTKYNITYTHGGSTRKAGVLGSYPTTYKMADTHGESCLEFIFSIIKNAGWNKEKNGYATFVTESLKNIWIQFPTNRKEIHKLLSEELRNIDPTLFSSEAKVKYPMRRDTRVSCRLYLEDMICEKLGLSKVA